MDKRRRFPIFVPLLFGIMALTNVMTKPRFATYASVDIVTLIAVGMCFGAALALFIARMREARAS